MWNEQRTGTRATPTWLLAPLAVAALGLGACKGSGESADTPGALDAIPQPTEAQLAAAKLDKLPVAPETQRVDLEAPAFSNPTEITNPLFPISELQSVIFTGRVENKPFHTETTLLPQTRMIEWSEGQWVEALISQYTAYIDGRVEEVALDFYAQSDDGAVWYLGEDVYDYSNSNGLVDGTAGTWLAGRDGPPEMIMPADPEVGDVHRPENIPAIAFEEVEIVSTDETRDGPTGPIQGVLIGRELHDDGTHSDKEFAPGYGEYYTKHKGEVEALALAVPTDAAPGPPPAKLVRLSTAANDLLGPALASDWGKTNSAERAAANAWHAYRKGDVPSRLAGELDRAFAHLTAAVAARNPDATRTAAIDVAQSALDLELQYRAQPEIDRDRFALWARQITVDAAADNVGGVNGDVMILDWIRDRFAHTIEPADLTAIDAHLEALRDAVVDADIEAAAVEAPRLLQAVESAEPAI